ncbi:sodium:solute symporter family transporter [Salinigranum halophilum]|jgi:Na+/proline symporter|uniref:sodium:solute symporter family transporter n=1 Tax=Salinigranum halophilum TaxID=2565931 RepID=UPI0010A9125C|nr:sodium:proline symporter [Salinigranum halophilum]
MVTARTTLAVTVLTLVCFTGLGLWYVRRRGGIRDAEEFVSARNSAGTGATTATLVASVMGVWILLAPVEAGAAFGGVSAVLGYAVGEAIPMLAYARLGPRIRELIPEGHSLTEYALARYGKGMYAFVLLVSVFYMFIFLAAELTGIASAFELVAGVPRWQTGVLVGGFVLLYTSYGGLPASIFTDAVQTVLVLPLLVLSAVGAVVVLGGPTATYEAVVATDPTLVDPTFFTGLRFGFWVAIAILGAELINQTWWQRIYAARDAETLKKGFRRAAVTNFCVVLVAGLFGVLARGVADIVVSGPEYNASVAFFVLLQEAFPEPLVIGVVLLALLLVMSTADTLFNALASVVTADLPRVLSDPDDRTLTWGARVLTVVVAVAAILVSLRAQSVLRLFLLADLFGAAVMVPLLYGLYSRRATGTGMLVASLAGLAVGLAFFPSPVVRSVTVALPVVGSRLPPADFLWAFVGAAGVSTLVAVLAARVAGTSYDLDRLAVVVRRFDTSAVDAPDEQTD